MAGKRTHENKVTGYLKPSLRRFVEGYSGLYEMSESKVVNQAIKALQDTTPKDIRERIVRTPSKNSY